VQRLRLRGEVSHLRHLNAANGQADPARQGRLISVLRHRNMAGHLRASQPKAQVRVRQAVRAIRRNRGREALNLRSSVLRPQRRAPVQVSRRVLSVGYRREFVSPVVRRRMQAVPLVKRVAREKEGRALMVNLAARQRVERLLEPRTARRSQRAERKDPREERHRQGHNNLTEIVTAAPEQRLRSRFFLLLSFVGRLCQTPSKFVIRDMAFGTNALQLSSVPRPIHDLLVVGKTFLVWPLAPVRDQTSSNWILSNVVPLFVN
jgi:hypothetical protein